jgi:hypothetical protein
MRLIESGHSTYGACVKRPNVPFSGAPFAARPLQRMVGRRSYDSN